MYDADIKTQDITITLPVSVLRIIREANTGGDAPNLPVQYVLAMMIIEKVNDICDAEQSLADLSPGEK